jgi:hypothetical protein
MIIREDRGYNLVPGIGFVTRYYLGFVDILQHDGTIAKAVPILSSQRFVKKLEELDSA